jgi:3'-phosphoadenosine 5'-phosphosulfate sulfotransferase (PAPS reductase)/FAD synthetase
MNVIITNFGDDSIALIQWAYEHRLENVYVLSVATGWEADSWQTRIQTGHQWIMSLGFNHQHIPAQATFSENILARQRFPSKKFHWCPSFLKGLAILDWLEKYDDAYDATILLANRSDMVKNSAVKEFIEEHEHYDDRKVWMPLHNTCLKKRDQLIEATPFQPLNHRSLECQPCIYNTTKDFQQLSDNDCQRVVKLEKKIGAPMFFPEDYDGAKNVAEIKEMALKKEGKDQSTHSYYKGFSSSCSWSYGCGL